MSKADAWMPLYIGDYLSDTMHLTCEQSGAYLHLIMHYWRAGSLPDNDVALAQIARLPLKAWKAHKTIVAAFFGAGWTHKRIDAERQKADGQVRRSRAGGEGKWGGDETVERGRHMRSQRMAEARKKGTHTPEHWAALVSFCGEQCARCGRVGKLVKDHITPIYMGGSDAIDNLQPLCSSCNSSKGPETTDYRAIGWKESLLNGLKMPAKCLPNACTLQSHLQGSNEPISSSNEDVSVEPTAKPLTVDEIVEAWNERMVPQGFSAVRRLTTSRRRQAQARIRENSIDDWQSAFGAIERSAFLRGDNDRGWRADFDFLLQPKSFTKLLEGAYDN